MNSPATAEVAFLVIRTTLPPILFKVLTGFGNRGAGILGILGTGILGNRGAGILGNRGVGILGILGNRGVGILGILGNLGVGILIILLLLLPPKKGFASFDSRELL